MEKNEREGEEPYKGGMQILNVVMSEGLTEGTSTQRPEKGEKVSHLSKCGKNIPPEGAVSAKALGQESAGHVHMRESAWRPVRREQNKVGRGEKV